MPTSCTIAGPVSWVIFHKTRESMQILIVKGEFFEVEEKQQLLFMTKQKNK